MKEHIAKLTDREYFEQVNDINRKIIVDVKTLATLEHQNGEENLDKILSDCEKSLTLNIQSLMTYINNCPLEYDHIHNYHHHYMETVKKFYSAVIEFIKSSKSLILNPLDYKEVTNYKKCKQPSIQLVKDIVKGCNNFQKVYYNPELQSEEDFETTETLIDSEQQQESDSNTAGSDNNNNNNSGSSSSLSSAMRSSSQQQLLPTPSFTPPHIIHTNSSGSISSNHNNNISSVPSSSPSTPVPPQRQNNLVNNNNTNNNINNNHSPNVTISNTSSPSKVGGGNEMGSIGSSPISVPIKILQDLMNNSPQNSPVLSPLKLSNGSQIFNNNLNSINIDKSSHILLECVIKIKQAALDSDSDAILLAAKGISNEVVNIAKDLKFKTLSKNLKEAAANLIHAARFVSKSKNDQYYIDQLELAGEKVNEVVRRTLYAIKSVSRTTINMNLRQSMLSTSSLNLALLNNNNSNGISSDGLVITNENKKDIQSEVSLETSKINNEKDTSTPNITSNNHITQIPTISTTNIVSPTLNSSKEIPVTSPTTPSPNLTPSSTTPLNTSSGGNQFLQPQPLPPLHPVSSPPHTKINPQNQNHNQNQNNSINNPQQITGDKKGDEKQKTFGKFISKLVNSNKTGKNKRAPIPFENSTSTSTPISPPITSSNSSNPALSKSLNTTPAQLPENNHNSGVSSLSSSMIVTNSSTSTSASTSHSNSPNSLTPDQLSSSNSPTLNNKQQQQQSHPPLKNKERSFTIGMVSGKHSHILLESPRSRRALAHESAKQILSVLSQKFPNFEKDLHNHSSEDLGRIQDQIATILKNFGDDVQSSPTGQYTPNSSSAGISPKLTPISLQDGESPTKDYQRISLRYKMTRKLGTIKKRPNHPFQNPLSNHHHLGSISNPEGHFDSSESEVANDYFINTASAFVEESIDLVNRCHEFSILSDLINEPKPQYKSTIDYLISILIHSVKLSKLDTDSYIHNIFTSSRDYIQNMKQRGGKCDSNLVTAATKLYKHVILANLDKSIHTLCHSVRVLAIQLTIIVISIASKPWDLSNQLQLFASAKCFSDVLVNLLDALENKYYITSSIDNASVLNAALSRVEDEDDDEDANLWDDIDDNSNVKYEWISDEGSKTGRYVPKAGTLNKLVEALTMEKQYDVSKFTKTFLLTYQSFVNPWKLFEKLKQRYHVPQDKSESKAKIQLRVVSFVQTWVEKNFDDFDDGFIKELKKFCDQLVMDDNNDLAYILRDKIQKKELERHSLGERNGAPSLSFPELMIPEGQKSPASLFLLLNDSEIARQLTLIDFNIFSKIEPTELLDQNWNKDSLKYKSPNVIEMINRANRFSYWVSSQILWQEDVHDRVKIIEKFIMVAKYLREQNNFNTLLAIFAGLNTAPILRLKKTFPLLSAQSSQIYKELEKLMSSASSYKNYRQATKVISPPYLPYLPVILSDLTMTEEGNPDKLGHLINFQKRELICRVISEVQSTQIIKYEFPIVEPIHTLLSELPSSTPNELYQLSLLREPRGDNSIAANNTINAQVLVSSYNNETIRKKLNFN